MLKHLITATLSLFLISALLPNVTYSSWQILAIAGIVLTFSQIILKPILKLLLLPITIITLGLFSGAVNVILLWLVTAVVPGFHIDPMTISGMRLSFFFSLVVVSFGLGILTGIISFILNKVTQ